MLTDNNNNRTLHPEDFILFRDFIFEKAGIYFEEKKAYFIEKRVFKRMDETDTLTPQEYYRILKFSNNIQEQENFINLITTNETYFFRNIPQLESFIEEALPMVLEEKRKTNNYRVNIWSAACSSGDEPYTIAILLKENILDFHKWKFTILASDINNDILKKAKKGTYDKRALKDLPDSLIKKYFIKLDESKYELTDEIKNMVQFETMNLMDRMAIRKKEGQDFVFCRNVLIYFNDESRKQVINSIYNCLNKNGFIFLGHSESVGKISAAFKLVKFKKSLSYQK